MGKVGALPIVGMMMTECAGAGVIILSKAAMSTGMSNLIFVFYSNALAALILLPTSLVFHSLLGMLGLITALLLLARLCSTSFLLLPSYWQSSSGAFIVTLYKGPALLLTSSTDKLSHNQLFSQQSNWVIGGILLLVYCVLASSSYIIQASAIKKYPAELIMVFYYCFFVAIQAVVVSLIVETDLSAWSLKPKMRLIAVVYSAVFGSTFTIGVTTWCLHRAGPVFIAMFKPLGIIVAVSIGVTFVGDTFYLGSLVGAIVIVIGFYSVMWGKANEEKMDGGAETKSLATSNQRVPLLQNTLEEI